MTKIGIPRALLYYYYYPMWKSFFEALGLQVVVSSKTTKGILNQGVKHAVDEACLPVKLFYGHVLDLKDKVDFVFVPRLVSVEEKAFICPKFLGLPDMIEHTLEGLPPIINVSINMSKKYHNLYKAVYEVGKLFTNSPVKIFQAYKTSVSSLNTFNNLLQKGFLPNEAIEEMEKGLIGQNFNTQPVANNELTIAVIGHPYNIYDSYINMNLIDRLREMGTRVVTADNLNVDIIEMNASQLPKKLFWTLGKRMLGSAFHYLDTARVDGVIHLAAFGCGPDSFTGELVERKVKRQGTVPFLCLTIDEHTGEAGIVTRLEAFLDMIRWRSDNESNLSSHG